MVSECVDLDLDLDFEIELLWMKHSHEIIGPTRTSRFRTVQTGPTHSTICTNSGKRLIAFSLAYTVFSIQYSVPQYLRFRQDDDGESQTLNSLCADLAYHSH